MSCAVCNDTHFVFYPGYAIPLPCPECGDKQALIRRYEARLDSLFGQFVFDAQHDFTSFIDLPDDQRQGKALGIWAMRAWTKRGGLIVLAGPSGTGKTTLAWTAMNSVNSKVPTLRCDAETLFDLLRQGFDDHLREDRLDALRNAPALLIDDLGRLGQNPASAHDTKALRTILDFRFQSRKATIVTTNLNQAQIAAQYDRTIVSRLARWGSHTLAEYESAYDGNGWIPVGGKEF